MELQLFFFLGKILELHNYCLDYVFYISDQRKKNCFLYASSMSSSYVMCACQVSQIDIVNQFDK